AVDHLHAHDLALGARVHAAALEARIDEGPEAHARDRPGLAGPDVTIEIRDHAFGQVVRLDLLVHHERTDPWREAVIAADHALHHPLGREAVESFPLRTALPRRVDQREAARRARLEKPLLERDEKLLGHAVAAVSRRRNDVAILDDRHRIGHGNDLLQDL